MQVSLAVCINLVLCIKIGYEPEKIREHLPCTGPGNVPRTTLEILLVVVLQLALEGLD